MKRNPEQFDRLGKIPGPVKLVVDPDIPQHIDAPSKTPIALRDAIKEELDSMVESGVIRKVTANGLGIKPSILKEEIGGKFGSALIHVILISH